MPYELTTLLEKFAEIPVEAFEKFPNGPCSKAEIYQEEKNVEKILVTTSIIKNHHFRWDVVYSRIERLGKIAHYFYLSPDIIGGVSMQGLTGNWIIKSRTNKQIVEDKDTVFVGEKEIEEISKTLYDVYRTLKNIPAHKIAM